MPWWLWLIIGILTGGVAVYFWLGWYFSKVYR